MRKFNRLKWTFAFVAVMFSSIVAFGSIKLRAGQMFPTFELSRLGQNSKVNLQQLQGKVAIIDFWASWCGPCKISFPFYNSLYRKYHSRGLEVVGVNVDDEVKSAQDFAKANPVGFTLLYDEGKKLVSSIGVATMPTSYFLNRKGKVVMVHRGFVSSDAEGLERRVRYLLAEKK